MRIDQKLTTKCWVGFIARVNDGEFIKGKPPSPIASQVDAVLAGEMSGIAGQAGEMLKGKTAGAFGG